MLEQIQSKIKAGTRISSSEAIWMYQSAPLEFLKQQAHLIRQKRHQDNAYYNINIHFEPTKIDFQCVNFF